MRAVRCTHSAHSAWSCASSKHCQCWLCAHVGVSVACRALASSQMSPVVLFSLVGEPAALTARRCNAGPVLLAKDTTCATKQWWG